MELLKEARHPNCVQFFRAFDLASGTHIAEMEPLCCAIFSSLGSAGLCVYISSNVHDS